MTLTLGIETSCDETAVAVLEGASTLRSNIVSSQLAQHRPYGGVVPELAARAHIENLPAVLDTALAQASVRLEEIERIGVTSGPGLIGALLAGAAYAKGLALGLGRPIFPVHHLEAHIFANLFEHPELEPPFLALVISGGHTLLARVEEWGSYRTVGATRDDAAGEAFDKVAKLLGLGYPGGARVEELAREGDPVAIDFPRPMRNDPSNDFSFSGLKTSVALVVSGADGGRRRRRGRARRAGAGAAGVRSAAAPDQAPLPRRRVADICASFQAAVVDSLANKTFRAADEEPTSAIVLAGGVSRNETLRARFRAEAASRGFPLYYPSPELCTDNAAMIARTAYHLAQTGREFDLDFPVQPAAPL